MRLRSTILIVLLIGTGCQTPDTTAPQELTATDDTPTEIALYGLVSWSAETDQSGSLERLVALMPDTSSVADCIGVEAGMQAPEMHFPVLKIVAGSPTWKDPLDPLPTFKGEARIFELAGQDVTIEPAAFDLLSTSNFNLLSSDTSLNATNATTVPDQDVKLDAKLLEDDLPLSEGRLGARIRFTRGTAIAALDECPDPPLYLAEQNTVRGDCPLRKGLPSRNLAEAVVVRLLESGAKLTLHFLDWKSGPTPKQRTLTIDPSSPGGTVRVELSNQMLVAARNPDSRDRTLCDHAADLRDYLWHYDLREPKVSCSAPKLFPCYATELGGTKCPQHDWGG